MTVRKPKEDIELAAPTQNDASLQNASNNQIEAPAAFFSLHRNNASGDRRLRWLFLFKMIIIFLLLILLSVWMLMDDADNIMKFNAMLKMDGNNMATITNFLVLFYAALREAAFVFPAICLLVLMPKITAAVRSLHASFPSGARKAEVGDRQTFIMVVILVAISFGNFTEFLLRVLNTVDAGTKKFDYDRSQSDRMASHLVYDVSTFVCSIIIIYLDGVFFFHCITFSRIKLSLYRRVDALKDRETSAADLEVELYCLSQDFSRLATGSTELHGLFNIFFTCHYSFHLFQNFTAVASCVYSTQRAYFMANPLRAFVHIFSSCFCAYFLSVKSFFAVKNFVIWKRPSLI